MADQVLHQGVRGITDLMIMPGLINLDFADIRTVMSEMGKAMMGTGEATGERRAIEAAEKAIANPLLDEVSMRGAKGVIINITGGDDLRLMEVDEAATHIRDMVDPDANIIVGSAFNKDLEGIMRVSVVATGIDAASRPNAVVPRPRAAAPTGFAAQPSIFATPAAIAPPPVPEVAAPAMAADDEIVAPAAFARALAAMEAQDDNLPEATIDDDDIDLGAVGERIDAPAVVDSFRFTPSDPAPAVASVAVEPPAPVAAPVEEERAPTLFEKMMNLSRGPRPKPASTTLAPEPPVAGAPDVDIPPFFKRQANN